MTSEKTEPVESIKPLVRSGVSICGGTLAPAVFTNIESEYQKLPTKVDADFKLYVLRILTANGVSQEKYDAFINCVEAVEEKEFALFDQSQQEVACDSALKQCVGVNKDCVEQTKQSCFSNCDTNKQLSRHACMDECAFGSLNRSIDSKVCVDLVANCEAIYSSCLDSVK